MVNSNRLQIKDLVTTGIYSAIYFVLNLIVMICGGISPIIWMAMPTVVALICGVIYLLLVMKVQKTGPVIFMGLITAIIYFATGTFTILVVITYLVACIAAEIIRRAGGFGNMAANIVSYGVFSIGLVGSPLPIWMFREDFLQQMIDQGMPDAYVSTLAAMTPSWVLILMIVATFIFGIIGGCIGSRLLKKHFKKAGLV